MMFYCYAVSLWPTHHTLEDISSVIGILHSEGGILPWSMKFPCWNISFDISLLEYVQSDISIILLSDGKWKLTSFDGTFQVLFKNIVHTP